jgi:hypothetical protein
MGFGIVIVLIKQNTLQQINIKPNWSGENEKN